MVIGAWRIVFAAREINTYERRVEYYFQRYGDIELHRRMLADRPRVDAFFHAISRVVRRGDVVLDVGTGTGILALMAARAGAKRVYGVDQADIVQVAANVAKANGLDDRCRFFRGPAGELSLPEKVDVIVSEWLGNLALVESMLDDVLAVRDAHLRRGGRMVPARVEVRIAPIDDFVLYTREGPGFWRIPVCDFDFTSLETLELKQGRACQLKVDASALLAEGQTLASVDVASTSKAGPYKRGEVSFLAKRDGVVNGFVGWFVADLGEGIMLDTAPGAPETHWAQTYLPFAPRAVKKGQELRVNYDLKRHADEPRHGSLDLRWGRAHETYVLE